MLVCPTVFVFIIGAARVRLKNNLANTIHIDDVFCDATAPGGTMTYLCWAFQLVLFLRQTSQRAPALGISPSILARPAFFAPKATTVINNVAVVVVNIHQVRRVSLYAFAD